MKVLKLFSLTLLISIGGLLIGQETSNYYFSKTVTYSFEEATLKTKAAFKDQGFGTITEIDMDVILKEKLPDADVQPYKILGLCNPNYAYETLQQEENIGLFLPCKAVVKYVDDNTSEVVIVNPSSLMKMLGNDDLIKVADQVTAKFKEALNNI